jgi:hypothetical protein
MFPLMRNIHYIMMGQQIFQFYQCVPYATHKLSA